MTPPVQHVAVVEPQTLLLFLLQFAVLLLAALLLGRLAVRSGLPAIVGELTAGVLLGPSALGSLAPSAAAWLLPAGEPTMLLAGVGQLAVIVLVGVAGAHLDHGVLRRQGALAFRLGIAGLVIPLVLGIAVGYLVPRTLLAPSGDRDVFAFFLGVALCVSAIPVIAKILLDMRLLHRDIGQLVLSSGAISDTVGWVLLSVVAAMASTGLHATTLLTATGKVALVLVVALVVGRPVVKRVLGRAHRSAEPSVLTASVVVILVAGGAGTLLVGLEPALGAFLAGLLIGTAPQVTPASLATLRAVTVSVLAPVFFATAGLSVDLTQFTEAPLVLTGLAILVVAILGKFLGAVVGAWRSRLTGWEVIAVGAGMNSRGVVEIVVASVGLRLGVLSTSAYTVVVGLAIITSVMAPPILRLAVSHAPQTAEEESRGAAYRAGHSSAVDGTPALAGEGRTA